MRSTITFTPQCLALQPATLYQTTSASSTWRLWRFINDNSIFGRRIARRISKIVLHWCGQRSPVSQAISSEIFLEKLIEALMSTSLKQAGADRGALLLLEMDALRIAAEATTDGSEMVVSLDNQPAANADLPQSVVQYVHRTLENVILDDAPVQNPYTTDSYIRQCNPRSVLCLPPPNQGKLM